jgi:hypothetical protein
VWGNVKILNVTAAHHWLFNAYVILLIYGSFISIFSIRVLDPSETYMIQKNYSVTQKCLQYIISNVFQYISIFTFLFNFQLLQPKLFYDWCFNHLKIYRVLYNCSLYKFSAWWWLLAKLETCHIVKPCNRVVVNDSPLFPFLLFMV